MERIAVIDLGTNTFHLLIATKDGKYIHSDRMAVKLGKGGINKGIITDEAFERALICLREFRKKMDGEGVTRAYATATSAVRNARNGKELVRAIEKETGIKVLVISGEEEAEFIYEGVKAALDLGTEPGLVMDIGGGSVEFIIGNQKEIFWKKSIEIGAQRLLEMFHETDPITDDQVRKLNFYVDEKLRELKTAAEKYRPECLIGSSGTFDTLAEMDSYHKNEGFIYTEAKEYLLSLEDFYRIHKEIVEKPREERIKIPGMIELRVDMIVVACCLIDHILKNFGIKKIRVSAYALKDGVLSLAIQGKL